MKETLLRNLNKFYFASLSFLIKYTNLNLNNVTKYVSSWTNLNQENSNIKILSDLDILEIDINCYLYQYYIDEKLINISSSSYGSKSEIINNFYNFYIKNDRNLDQTFKCIKNDIIRLKKEDKFGNIENINKYPIIFNFFTHNTPIINWKLQYLTYFPNDTYINYERKRYIYK